MSILPVEPGNVVHVTTSTAGMDGCCCRNIVTYFETVLVEIAAGLPFPFAVQHGRLRDDALRREARATTSGDRKRSCWHGAPRYRKPHEILAEQEHSRHEPLAGGLTAHQFGPHTHDAFVIAVTEAGG